MASGGLVLRDRVGFVFERQVTLVAESLKEC